MDINNFGPFKADVWGTVSEWCMFIITSITAWYLAKTLRSQQVVQSLQQEITRIESFRHRETLKPSIKLTSRVHKVDSDEANISIVFKFIFDLLGNVARNVKVDFEASDEWLIVRPTDVATMYPNEPFVIYGQYKSQRDLRFSNLFNSSFIFTIYFSDIDNHNYSQEIKVLCFSGDIFITPEIPVLVK